MSLIQGQEPAESVDAGLRENDETQQHQHPPQDYQIGRDRPRRTNVKPPSRFNDYEMMFYALHVAEQIELAEPSSYTEKEQWIKAMRDEIDSLLSNKTWIIVTKAKFRKVIGCKWVFKKKYEVGQTQKVRYKARLAAKGFNQEEGGGF